MEQTLNIPVYSQLFHQKQKSMIIVHKLLFVLEVNLCTTQEKILIIHNLVFYTIKSRRLLGFYT